ncbi:MAG: hypothetical protein JW771_07905 [Candidatus Thermoplasmatota archaeon]|nr:hypothetical protein [Candidatus Thermoplasmatota archaeon]
MKKKEEQRKPGSSLQAEQLTINQKDPNCQYSQNNEKNYVRRPKVTRIFDKIS